jgi:hypothetical protein
MLLVAAAELSTIQAAYGNQVSPFSRPTPEPLPRFSGEHLPDPPAQKLSWTPPTGALPPDLIKITQLLYDQGLADPRGCGYREITVVTGNVTFGEAGISVTHGWVLPGVEDGQCFAVCWNGLVYPVVSVGKACSVKNDVERVLTTKQTNGLDLFDGDYLTGAESLSISPFAGSTVRCVLLTRLGETGLASRMWKAVSEIASEQPGTPVAGGLVEVYRRVASAWLFSLYDREMGAYVRGDDHLALATDRILQAAEGPVRGTAAALTGTNRIDGDPFDFLADNPKLGAELERRVKLLPRKMALDLGRKAFPDKAAWIKALIEDLDEVNEMQTSQPGMVVMSGSPIVQALVAEDGDAVEPLLDCVANDTRLTRSVGFFRSFWRANRHVISVHSAAYTALTDIFQKSFDDQFDGNDWTWPRVAAAMTYYWKERMGHSLQEQWLLTLADDHRGSNEWLEAAQNIVRPANLHPEPHGRGIYMLGSYEPNGSTAMAGESLRNNRNPSVTQLLEKRMDQLVGEDENQQQNCLNDALDIADALMTWDPKGGAEPARVLCNKVIEIEQQQTDNSYKWEKMSRFMRLVTSVADSGDSNILNDYARWVKAMNVNQVLLMSSDQGTFFNPPIRNWFLPLWKYKDAAAIKPLADYLFSDAHSPWFHYFRTPSEWSGDINLRGAVPSILVTPIVQFKAVRDLEVHGLMDQTQIGFASRTNGQTTVSLGSPPATTAPSKGLSATGSPTTDAPVRVCDVYANWLTGHNGISGIEGMRDFDFMWPQHRRDEAVDADIDVLARFGGRYIAAPANRFPDPLTVSLAFPKLDRPATSADAGDGLAIFSLPPGTKSRSVPLSKFPMPAHWTKVATDDWGNQPMTITGLDTDTQKPVRVSARNEGKIWQAEEAWIDGKWVRYYGYTNEHYVGRIPAEEIEVEPESPFNVFERGLLFSIRIWAAPRASEPIKIIADFYNPEMSGIMVPPVLYDSATKLLAEGVEILLYRKIADTGPAMEMGAWERVPMKTVARFKPGAPDRLLEQGENWHAMEFDLRDLFEVKPGIYAIGFAFDAAKLGFSGGVSETYQFGVAE